jgi:hypothetical protein
MVRFRSLLPLLLILLYVGQCVWFIAANSLTYDEPHHIKAGLEMWRLGRFEFTDGHPSFPRMWYALPLLSQNFQVEQVEENTATALHPSPEAITWRARLMQVLLGVALGLVLWNTARRIFSEGAAHFALALFAFSPALVAHFSVATTDAAGVLMTLATPAMLLHWRRKPRGWRTVALGIVLGLLLLAKYYTPPLFLLALFWVMILKEDRVAWRPREWNWRSAVGLAGIAAVAVWAGYFFYVAKATLSEDRTVRLEVPGHEKPLVKESPVGLRAALYVPALEYVGGFGAALDHNRRGHNSYFLGEVSKTGGWKLYFPTVILLKWPTVVLLLLVIATILAFMGRYPWPRGSLILFSFPVLFFIPAITSKINIGDRHILPVYPFVVLFLAGLWQAVVAPGSASGSPSKSSLSRRKLWCALLIAAVLLMAVDTLRYAPDYLSWFNVFVEPEESWRLLADSSLDWGQGLLALRTYQQQHPDETIYLAYYGNVAPEVYGIRYAPLRPGERVRGTVVISSVHLAGRLLDDPRAYHWLLQYKRRALLNRSLHVFQVE